MGKIFCRVYQGVFKIGMYVIPWGMPKTLEGAGSVKKLPALIREQSYTKVLVVTDSVLMGLGLLDSLFAAMTDAGVEYVVYDGVQPNPTDINVEEGLKHFRDNNCQAMVAFGGGSPMDCCKAIGALAVTVPEAYVGDVMGDLSKRRGRPMGMTPDHDGNTVIEAEVPMAEMGSYAIDLRAMTQARGSFTLEFVRYEEVPKANQAKIIADAKAED